MSRIPIFLLALVCLASRAPGDTGEALRQLDLVYSSYFRWFGSMYDRPSGGAFYSFPSRERPDLYPPHIESTSKYSRVIEWSEIVPRVPAGERDAMIDFMKSRQIGDPGHSYYGYFLDANYPTIDPGNNGATVTERDSGRALGFATGLIELLGATPDHPLPGSGTGAVPSHLASGQAFKDWIDTLDWDRSWTPGTTILGQNSLINALDPELREEILAAAWEHLPTYQDSTTGLWGNLSSAQNQEPYIALNGGHKLAAFYEGFDVPIPHADALLATALDEVTNVVPTNLLYTYNSSQLVFNLQTSLETPMPVETRDTFIAKQASNLALFRLSDGGFTGTTGGGTGAGQYGPSASVAYSDTDVGGLALKARDTLNELANGKVIPLPWAADDRIFAMSGEIGEQLAMYDFASKSLTAVTSPRANASVVAASGTDSTGGPDNDGFQAETGPINSVQLAHSGFNDQNSYYEFTLTPSEDPLQLFFLAIWSRNGSSTAKENVVLKFSTDGGTTFLEAPCRTTVPGSNAGLTERAFPLLTVDALQDLAGPVIFRIHGWNFGGAGRTFRLDGIQVFGRAKPSSLSLSAPVYRSGEAKLELTVPTAGTYCIEATETLADDSWSEMVRHENLAAGQTLFVRDPDAGTMPKRFYRARPVE